eukprot:765949-Hanusia_phi.AAC.1
MMPWTDKHEPAELCSTAAPLSLPLDALLEGSRIPSQPQLPGMSLVASKSSCLRGSPGRVRGRAVPGPSQGTN